MKFRLFYILSLFFITCALAADSKGKKIWVSQNVAMTILWDGEMVEVIDGDSQSFPGTEHDQCLVWVDDQQNTYQLCQNVLKPGGREWLLFQNGNLIIGLFDQLWFHWIQPDVSPA